MNEDSKPCQVPRTEFVLTKFQDLLEEYASLLKMIGEKVDKISPPEPNPSVDERLSNPKDSETFLGKLGGMLLIFKEYNERLRDIRDALDRII